MTLPTRVNFENLGTFAYERLGFREPRKGEFYLSGAIVSAWRAPNDLNTKYHVVAPIGRTPTSPDGVKRNGDNYTLADCEEAARSHAAYGWSKRPWGHWSPEQVDAYHRAFDVAEKESR